MVSASGKRLAVNISSKTVHPDGGCPDPESESRPRTPTSRWTWSRSLVTSVQRGPATASHGAESDFVTLSLTTSASNLGLGFPISQKGPLD